MRARSSSTIRDRDAIDEVLRSLAGGRFCQDSPILPEVWLAYQDAPGDAKDLLITPHLDARAGHIANELREAIHNFRTRKPKTRREPSRVAHMPGIVAAELYFDELIRLVLPRTPWWRKRTFAAKMALRKAKGGEVQPTAPGADTSEQDADLFPLKVGELEAIAGRIEELVAASGRSLIAKHGELPIDFLQVVALSGKITRNSAARRQKADTETLSEDIWGRLKSFASLFEDWPAPNDAYEKTVGRVDPESHDSTNVDLLRKSFWRVSINRRTETAITKSALAVKADAARRLFQVSCKDITWAVIDSGIDRDHDAFLDWDAMRPNGPRPSRVIRTYDFLQVREYLDPARVAKLFLSKNLSGEEHKLRERLELSLKFLGIPDPSSAAPRYVKQLRERLERGLEIDWALLEPFLLVTEPPAPPIGHGTHVAGILGADWRQPNGKDTNGATTYKILMQGVCPDIRLMDMRVLRSDGYATEFEVIAALQFIRYLNSRADSRIVHGANLSLSTPHEVKSYACGSTPVCEECDRTWNSGVVLVAAAGNHGHQDDMADNGRVLGSYHSISITDPGNAEGVITVGATHRIEPHKYGVSYFSSRGPTGDGRLKPDLVAPGEKIDGPLPFNASGRSDGTSLAAPHVSGAAAMLMARYNELIGRPAKIKKILCDNATDLGREPYFQGAGMLDILRAFQSV